MRRFQATLAYDGTPYQGWQIQPDRPTVQGTLAAALHHLTGETTLPQGAGRTDTGVHALAQVAHLDLECSIPPENLHRALNRSLPPSIRVLTLAPAAADFHARHHALHKTYEYRILPRAISSSGTAHETICPPSLAPYVWPCPRPLNLECLNRAAAAIVGTHDFTSFAAVNPDQSARQADPANSATNPPVPHPARLCEGWGCSLPDRQTSSSLTGPPPTPNTRTILSSEWTHDQSHDPPILRYRITGTGFLHHMVRNLVGTFTEHHRYPPETIRAILAARDRRTAGPTAPPQGLFLAEVAY